MGSRGRRRRDVHRTRVPRRVPDDLSHDEQMAVHLAHEVRRSGDVAGLVAALHQGAGGRRHAREALDCLGELDRELLVDIALEALVAAHLSGR